MYGIIGYPLLLTFSPGYFTKKFEALGIGDTYSKFPLASIQLVKGLLEQNPELKGLNVTIPYKQEIIPFLDELDDTALHIGAVNCIRIREGKLKGYNTDTLGFTKTLKPVLKAQHTHALILGTGGASKAVAYSLKQLGISFRFVSRHKSAQNLTYAELDEKVIAAHTLIINCTPLGMAPETEACPDLPYHLFGPGHLLYDLIYNPEETLFLKKGKAMGATIKNGYDMLIEQAEASWQIWQET